MNTSSSSSSVHPTPRRAPLTKAYSCSDTSTSDCAFITPKEFVNLISQDSNALDLCTVPILDCRSQMDFGCERIRSSHNINCRTKIVARKLASKRLEDVEPNLSSSLNASDLVILYDQSSDAKSDEKNQVSPINLVVQAAQKSNKKVHIIQGGLDAVKTEFPYLIECPAKSTDDELTDSPSTPETIDKENFVMTEIMPQIFVGNVCDAQNLDRLKQFRITHILNSTPDLPFYWENQYTYKRIDVLDLPSQNIRQYFDPATDFIEQALKNKENNVLIHCSAGISRSPTLVLAYMIKKHRFTFEEAFETMRKLRPIVDPNVSFILQLREWEKSFQTSTESSEEHVCSSPSTTSAAAGTRSGSSGSYCGSSSKSKNESNTRADSSAIPVS